MTSVFIGIVAGLSIMVTLSLLKHLDKTTVYALILSAIGFLYVGFTWSDTTSLILTFLQAVFFLFMAYFGVKKNFNFLVAGYLLHGIWDLIYNLLPGSNLIPPHYDLFCFSVDFSIAIYLVVLNYRNVKGKLALNIN